MLSKKEHDAFEHFCEVAYNGEILGAKTTVMLQLASSMAAGCYP